MKMLHISIPLVFPPLQLFFHLFFSSWPEPLTTTNENIHVFPLTTDLYEKMLSKKPRRKKNPCSEQHSIEFRYFSVLLIIKMSMMMRMMLCCYCHNALAYSIQCICILHTTLTLFQKNKYIILTSVTRDGKDTLYALYTLLYLKISTLFKQLR